MYDLLLKGGTVLDPSSRLDGAMDVAVEKGAIARVAPQIAETEAARTIDVRGKTVTPGLIDLHAHVFEGFNRTGVNPDLGGVYAGVTTIVDAGSAGSATFGGFPRHILPHCHTEVIPFLHICATGLATLPDIIAESSVNLDDTLKVVDQHRGLIRGIKARMVSPALEIMGMEMPRLAKRAAKESGVKLMVHIGDTEKRYDPKVIRSLLPLLEPGDILTHYFTANPGGVLDGNGKLVPEVREAADRGVWFDTAHGRMNFSFDVGRRVIEQGVLPHCISTDLTVPGRIMTVHAVAGGDHVHREPGAGGRRRGPAGQPGGGPAGRHLGARCPAGRLDGLRRPGCGAAGGPRGDPVRDRQEGARVHAGLGTARVGLGARPRAARVWPDPRRLLLRSLVPKWRPMRARWPGPRGG
jgi:dihydroorotase